MKQQITRISLHQNAKIGSIWMSLNFLMIFLPFIIYLYITGKFFNNVAFYAFFFAVPLFYFFLTYVSTILFSISYNIIAKYFGGFEYEYKDFD